MALSNTQYDAIMHQYSAIRHKHQEELNNRIAYVYDNVPGYRELDSKVSDISLEFAMAHLQGFTHPEGDLHKKLDDLRLSRQKLLKEASLPKDYLELSCDCRDCHDTGYIGSNKCHCFQQKIVELLYSQSNLDILTQTENFTLLSEEYFHDEQLINYRKIVASCWNFIENFDSLYQNIFFYGTVGTGKSFLSVCIARELLDRGHSVVYFSSCDLFRNLSDIVFRSTSSDHSARSNMYDTLYNCELLIIDDLGTELTNEFVRSELFTCLNERIQKNHPIIISTNLSLPELQQRYEDRIFSRITSNFQMNRLNGPDLRMYKFHE